MVSAKDIASQIEASLPCQSNVYYGRIRFDNSIIFYGSIKKIEKRLHYDIKI